MLASYNKEIAVKNQETYQRLMREYVLDNNLKSKEEALTLLYNITKDLISAMLNRRGNFNNILEDLIGDVYVYQIEKEQNRQIRRRGHIQSPLSRC